MYLEDYLIFIVLISVCMIFSIYASNKVKTSFSKYNQKEASSRLTGREVIERLMLVNGISEISISRVRGNLTDHYHPSKKIINLSDSTYDNNSIASVSVAAHEMGHVLQEKEGYIFYRIRTAIVPIVNFGSRLAMPLVLIGLLIDLFSLNPDSNIGFYIAMVGVVLYGGAFLFSLITLPVEFDASRKAKKMLLENGILNENELEGSKKVLSAAALTYLASMMTSLVYFLRFLIRILTIFGRRNNNR